MTTEIITVLAAFASQFTKPTWKNIRTLFFGAVLCRGEGKKIKAKGVYRDGVRSSQSKVITSFGLKWECMMLIVLLPWCLRPWTLPFLTLLSSSKKANQQAGRRHKISIDWTTQMMMLVTRWLKRPWILLGDGAYACMDLASACLKQGVTLINVF